MDLLRLNEIWNWARSHPLRAGLFSAIVIVVFLGAAFGSGYFGEIGRKRASELEHETIVIEPNIRHVGVNYKEEYPAEKEGGMTQVLKDFTLRTKPRRADLIVEVYDIDQIGGEVLINGEHVGFFTDGVPWHENHFPVKGTTLKPGSNKLIIKSNMWPNGQIEDFLFRNVRVKIEY